jgi:hypothetical protein
MMARSSVSPQASQAGFPGSLCAFIPSYDCNRRQARDEGIRGSIGRHTKIEEKKYESPSEASLGILGDIPGKRYAKVHT